VRRILAVAVSCAALAGALAAQTPGAGLATPPAGARHFVIQSVAARHGDSWIWVTPDGVRMGRETFNLRGQIFDVDSSGKAGSDGMPAGITIRGTTPQGDSGETFTIDDGTARWKSPVDAGSAPYARPAFYSSQGGPIDLPAGGLHASRSAGGGHDRTREAAGTGGEHRIDHRGQGGGSGAGRRRSFRADRRSPPDARRDARRQAAGCRRAAHAGGVLRAAQVTLAPFRSYV
jgi:hypothetical protein